MNNSRFSGSRVSQTKLYKKNGDVMLTLKAYNGRCVMEWLAVRVYEAYLNPQYAAFDPTRFCVIAGAMSLGGTLIARSDLQPNCVCERAKQE